MNKEQLKKNVGRQVLLRPVAVGVGIDGHDDEWLIATVSDEAIELVNVRTQHRVLMGLDALFGFTSNPARDGSDGVKRGFLQLVVQVETMVGGSGRIEPLPFARGGSAGAAAYGANLLRLDLRKAVAEAHLQIEDLLDLIRKALQSRHGVISASQLGPGAMRGARAKYEADAKEIGQMKRTLPNETHDFSAMSAAELETELVRVHSVETRTRQWREGYSRELAIDDQRRQEFRARAEAQLRSIRQG